MRLSHTFLTISLLTVATPAFAQDGESYAALYGDGIRAYTEARYNSALQHLYRAFALKQTPYALKLIVRAHDFQGNCSARERAAELLTDTFPDQRVPRPQTCREVGTIQITCAPHDGEVLVAGRFLAECGATIRVPAGTVSLENPKIRAFSEVSVAANQTIEVSLILSPSKWYLDDAGRGESARYRFVELPNGEVVVRSNLRRDPDMPRDFDPKSKTNDDNEGSDAPLLWRLDD